MKQSDILSFAINGVQKEIKAASDELLRLREVLAELVELDQSHAEPEQAVGRPAGFVYEPLVVCKSCKINPCVCVSGITV